MLMPTSKTIAEDLADAERLLLDPTAANMECTAELMATLVARASSSPEIVRALAGGRLERARLARVRILLDTALRLRLGLERAALAGLHGYSADGHAVNCGQMSAEIAGAAAIVAIA